MEDLQKTYSKLHVVVHPLVEHKLTFIRNKYTSKKVFKELVDEVGIFLACELTKDFPLVDVEVETPLVVAKTKVLKGKKPVLVPILRAGIGMLDGFLKVMPSARVGHIGMVRNEETLQPATYYFKLPSDSEERTIILIDPMLATGGSAIAAAGKLKELGVKKIKFMCLIAAPEGIRNFCDNHPDIDVYTACVDEKLNEQGYIIPGLGDAGDRLCGTKPNPSRSPLGVSFY